MLVMIYSTEPADFKKGIDVVGCYIEHAGEFLLLYRQPLKSNGNKWGMPAGKVDVGETKSQAMSREIREETGIEISETDLQYFDSVFVQHEGTDFIYYMFSVQLVERPKVTISPQEHHGFRWVSPAEAKAMDNLVHDNEACIELFYPSIHTI